MQTHIPKWPQWQYPPWILPAYFVFALLATLLEFSLFFAPQFHRTIVPVIGWTGLMIYMFTLFFTLMAMTAPTIGTYGIPGLLFLGAFFGVADFCQHLSMTEDFGNPYLMYSPWRPLVTIALPLLWGMALKWSPAMIRWNNHVLAIRSKLLLERQQQSRIID